MFDFNAALNQALNQAVARVTEPLTLRINDMAMHVRELTDRVSRLEKAATRLEQAAIEPMPDSLVAAVLDSEGFKSAVLAAVAGKDERSILSRDEIWNLIGDRVQSVVDEAHEDHNREYDHDEFFSDPEGVADALSDNRTFRNTLKDLIPTLIDIYDIVDKVKDNLDLESAVIDIVTGQSWTLSN